MAKTFTCKTCGHKSEKIGVSSSCHQTLNVASDSWSSPEVEQDGHGFCLECATQIPAKEFKRLTGMETEVVPDYKSLLKNLVDSYENTGCEDCGTVSSKTMNAARKAFGFKPL